MSDKNLIIIDKDDIPSKSISIMLEPPKFRDYRNARRRYPYPNSNNNQSPGYSVEELLFAMQFVGINEKKWEVPRDVIDRLNPLQIEDKQYLMVAFIEAFFLDAATAKTGRAYAQDKSLDINKMEHTISKELMPSGQHSVTFIRPSTRTQIETDRKFQGPETNGCSLEELLFANCVLKIDGKENTEVKDPLAIFEDWEIADVQFATLVFINMFTIDEQQSMEAKSLGKRMRAGSGPQESSIKAKASSAPVITEPTKS